MIYNLNPEWFLADREYRDYPNRGRICKAVKPVVRHRVKSGAYSASGLYQPYWKRQRDYRKLKEME